jgi:hypothetical protein
VIEFYAILKALRADPAAAFIALMAELADDVKIWGAEST